MSNFNKVFILFIMVLSLSVIVCKDKGDKSAGNSGGKKVKIGIIHFLKNHPDHIILRETFLDGLKAMGYNVEVENIFDTNSPKYPDTYQERPPVEAKRMEKAGVDLIYNTATGHLSLKANTGIPQIDCVYMSPLNLGYAEKRSDGKVYIKGNATGSRFGYSFKDIVNLAKTLKPKAKKIAYLFNPKSPISRPVDEIKTAANAAGLTVVECPFENKSGVIDACKKANKLATIGFATNDVAVLGMEKDATELVNKLKFPLIYGVVPLVDVGAVAAIQYDWARAGKICAEKADRIFKGEKATDIPIEYPDSIEIGINLKTLKAIGLETPHEWVEAAAKVVE